MVYLLHVLATRVVILRRVRYRGWLHRDIVSSEEELYRVNYNYKTFEVLTDVLMRI
jgi:hypothetical protein